MSKMDVAMIHKTSGYVITNTSTAWDLWFSVCVKCQIIYLMLALALTLEVFQCVRK